MIANDILELAQERVKEVFKTFPKEYTYHNWDHTKNVVKEAGKIGKAEGISSEGLLQLQIAAYFHDTGYSDNAENHEMYSAKNAIAFLQESGVEQNDIDIVERLILATKIDATPSDILEAVIKDADVSHLGKKTTFFTSNSGLRKELAAVQNKSFTDQEWYDFNEHFIAQHTFYTLSAKLEWEDQKHKNLERLKLLLVSYKASIIQDRNAQNMFKTAMRNHIALTNIADNKANILLTINSLILTIVLPLIVGYLREHSYMIVPACLLVLTCVSSIIISAKATRPVKMTGTTDLSQLVSGSGSTANLFFFGNYYNLPIDEYKKGLTKVLRDSQLLDDTIMNDLYFLGKSLGEKFNLLRLSYKVFMIGITITVIAFTIAFVYEEVLHHSL